MKNPLDRLDAPPSALWPATKLIVLVYLASSAVVRLACSFLDHVFPTASAGTLMDASPLQLAVEAILSIFLIDLISGIFHVALDHSDPGPLLRYVIRTSREAVYETRDTDWRYSASGPWRTAIWNFQNHHNAPFPEHDDQIVETAIIATPLLVATLVQYAFGLGSSLPASHCRVWCLTLLLGHFVQVVHFQAHKRVHLGEEQMPRWIVMLQDAGVLLSPAVHRVHHETVNTAGACSFCIFNGWANPIVDGALQLAKWAQCVPGPELRLQVTTKSTKSE